MALDLSIAKQNTALFYHPAALLHDTGEHPENASRIRAVLEALAQNGWSNADLLRPKPVALEVLERVHNPAYIDTIRRVSEMGGGYWDLDTYISPDSYDAATLGVGAAVAAVDSVMQEDAPRASFAIMRPPGHHALKRSAMGFCLFNNVAVAADYATQRYGLSRVMIIDWDIHHGNGTQGTFYDRSDVLFFSMHRYPFYPGTGALNETGTGKGRGYTVNVPLPSGVGDVAYGNIFRDVLAPLALRYKPELILISAGYDAHKDDPLGDANVSTAGFAAMTAVVRTLADEIAECKSRVAAVLEGGYNIQALAESVIATIGVLGAPLKAQSDPVDISAGRKVREPEMTQIIRRVREIHQL